VTGARTPCFDILTQLANMQVIRDLTRQTGVVYVTWCRDIPPYAHIVYVNTNDSRVKFQ
jgi:hypothetical protein